jgi:NAD(P)H-dependent FMN reductase
MGRHATMAERTAVRVLMLLGSLRSASINRQLAHLAIELAPPEEDIDFVDRLGELPFYLEDLDTVDAAEPVQALRRAASAASAALVVTPEYNGSVPGVLKNAIDWLSRPYGDGALKGKPLAVIGAALGRYGGTWAHDEARKSFGVAGAQVVNDLHMSLPTKSLNGAHPRDSAVVVAEVRKILIVWSAQLASLCRPAS